MKKIIFITFLSILVPNISWAINSCSDLTNETSCKEIKGCYWGVDATNKKNVCNTCPNYKGTFETGTITCTECWGTLGNGVSFDEDTAANNNCKWTATCNPGEYFNYWIGSSNGCQQCSAKNAYGTLKDEITYSGTTNSKTYYANGEKKTFDNKAFDNSCQQCGQNAVPNDTGLNCNCASGFYKVGSKKTTDNTTDIDTADCTNSYTINLRDPLYTGTTPTTKTYDEYKNNKTELKDFVQITNIPFDTTRFPLPHPEGTESENTFVSTDYTLANWQTPNNTTQKYQDYYDPTTSTDLVQTLTAQWTLKPFNITYKICEDTNTIENIIFTDSDHGLRDCTTTSPCTHIEPYNTDDNANNLEDMGACICSYNYQTKEYTIAFNSCIILGEWQDHIVEDSDDLNNNLTTSCTPGEDCIIGDYKFSEDNSGLFIFTNYWKCTYTETRTPCKGDDFDTLGRIKAGANLTTNTEDITLTALWEPCPTGYYCPNSQTTKKCPGGTTTEPPQISTGQYADSTNACMTGENTIITGANGNFKLPAGLIFTSK